MPAAKVRVCQCPHCQRKADHPNKELHKQMNLLLSRLDEQQRRWYVAVEADRIGHGGIRSLTQITGMDAKTIRRGRQELAGGLASRPTSRVRLPGGGRPPARKKIKSVLEGSDAEIK
jgi:hypothetical protein